MFRLRANHLVCNYSAFIAKFYSAVLCFSVIEDLQEVRSQLIEVVVNWRDIGLELGLTHPELERIGANNRHNVTDCLTAMLRD